MLIPKTSFIGLEEITHLCAGGETPMLKSHQAAIDRFFADKVLGEESRARLEATYQRCKAQAAQLLGVEPESIAFVSSASEGVNLIAHALEWRPGDNVVVCDVEFPSDVLPWTTLQRQEVEIRTVSQRDWLIHLEDIEAAIDERTRVVDVSHVSYFTGQRLPLDRLSEIVRASNALLIVDATHAAGAVPVQASYADILVSSCYKWLLGVHGTAIFYWNRERLPDLEPPFLGWHTGVTIPDWQAPTRYTLRPNADRFVPGNPSFISLYVLENALDQLLKVGMPAIEAHVLNLSGQVWAGLDQAGWQVMTPREPAQRAGNICFLAPNVGAVTTGLAERGVLVWGSYGGVGGRIRVSTHLYNTEADVERLLVALNDVRSEIK
jgi:selenocysteine lyase/cysteine desulfurase